MSFKENHELLGW